MGASIAEVMLRQIKKIVALQKSDGKIVFCNAILVLLLLTVKIKLIIL
jgi:hypothetical protein